MLPVTLLYRNSVVRPVIGLILLAGVVAPVQAGWKDVLGQVLGGGGSASAPATASAPAPTSGGAAQAPTTAEQESGLRAAISGFATAAIQRLGKQGGFANDPLVRIPVPEQLQPLKAAMAKLGQKDLFDSFEASMNRAAEDAVKDSAPVFVDAVKSMSISDAARIIGGSDNAATDYFREKTGAALRERFRPEIAKVTEETGVTRYYKTIVSQAGFLGGYLNKDALDLDGYVTDQSMDGLFKVMAEEEKRLRANPLGATSDLVRKVFDWFK